MIFWFIREVRKNIDWMIANRATKTNSRVVWMKLCWDKLLGVNPLSVLPAWKQLEFLLAPEIFYNNKKTWEKTELWDKCWFTTVLLRGCSLVLIFLSMLSSSSRTELGDIFNLLHSMETSLHTHSSSWLPGLLCLVEGEDGVEIWPVTFISSW